MCFMWCACCNPLESAAYAIGFSAQTIPNESSDVHSMCLCSVDLSHIGLTSCMAWAMAGIDTALKQGGWWRNCWHNWGKLCQTQRAVSPILHLSQRQRFSHLAPARNIMKPETRRCVSSISTVYLCYGISPQAAFGLLSSYYKHL